MLLPCSAGGGLHYFRIHLSVSLLQAPDTRVSLLRGDVCLPHPPLLPCRWQTPYWMSSSHTSDPEVAAAAFPRSSCRGVAGVQPTGTGAGRKKPQKKETMEFQGEFRHLQTAGRRERYTPSSNAGGVGAEY